MTEEPPVTGEQGDPETLAEPSWQKVLAPGEGLLLGMGRSRVRIGGPNLWRPTRSSSSSASVVEKYASSASVGPTVASGWW